MKLLFPKLLIAVFPFVAGMLAVRAAEPEQHIKVLEEMAQKGDGPSQLKLALDYEAAGDSPKAARWFLKAASKGYVLAARDLGVRLFHGEGVPRDEKEAVKWFRMAAEHGDAEAQYNLATCYANGSGVSKNIAKAVLWCKEAARQYYPDAEYMMGVFYGRGDGVSQDYVTSFEWVRRAEVHGNSQAVQSLETLKHVMSKAQIAKAEKDTNGTEFKILTRRTSP